MGEAMTVRELHAALCWVLAIVSGTAVAVLILAWWMTTKL